LPYSSTSCNSDFGNKDTRNSAISSLGNIILLRFTKIYLGLVVAKIGLPANMGNIGVAARKDDTVSYS